jgi:DNA-binding beta-propeller fold protein YncE
MTMHSKGNDRNRAVVAGAALLVAGSLPAAGWAAPSWPPAPAPARIVLAGLLPATAQPPASRPSAALRAFRWLVGLPPGGEVRTLPGLIRPTGLFVRGDALYVADPGRHAVVQIDLLTRRIVRAFPADPSLLPSPVGVVVTAGGVAFVTDSAAGTVREFGPDGRSRGVLAASDPPLLRPTGIALDERRGRLYVADTAGHRIHVFTTAGRHLFAFGGRGSGPGQLNFPTYVWLDGMRDELLVCDSANFRVQRFAPDGTVRGAFGEPGDRPGYLPRPRGLGTDSDRNVYVVDAALEAVQIFDLKGTLALWFGESGSDEGSFSLPGGLFVDGTDRIYVADTYNARVQVFQYLKGSKKSGHGT